MNDAVEEEVTKTQFDRFQEAEVENGDPSPPDQEQFFRAGKMDGGNDELPWRRLAKSKTTAAR